MKKTSSPKSEIKKIEFVDEQLPEQPTNPLQMNPISPSEKINNMRALANSYEEPLNDIAELLSSKVKQPSGSFSPLLLNNSISYPLSFLPSLNSTGQHWASHIYPNLIGAKTEEDYELETRDDLSPSAFPMRIRSFSETPSPKNLMLMNQPYSLEYGKDQFFSKNRDVLKSPNALHSFPSTSLTSAMSEARAQNDKLSLSTSSDLSFSVPNRFFEKFMITVIRINHNIDLNQPYVKVTFGDKVFQTSVAKCSSGDWNESFEFQVSYHYQLFGTCQLDLYETNWLLPDSHRGRAEIRIALLESFPNKFKSYYELYNKKNSTSTISEIARRNNHDPNMGAIQAKIQYRYMKQSDFEDSDFLLDDSSIPISAEPISILGPETEEPNITTPINKKEASPINYEQLQKIEDTNSTTCNSRDPGSKNRRSLLTSECGSYFDQEEEEDDSMFNFVGSYILSKSTRTVLKGVTRVYLAFFQGMELRHVEFFSGILLLENFYSSLEKQRIKNIAMHQEDLALTNFSIVSEAFYLHKYACAVYGWRGLVFFRKIPALGSTQAFSDHAAVKKYLGLEDDHLLGYEFHSNQIFQPTYFIAIDQKTNSIVLSIRGTMSVLDALVDLVCDYLPWRGGLVHSGVLSMAQSLMRHVIPGVMVHAVKHQIKKIFIVGHSLGGAAAYVLTMMFLDHLHEFRLPGPQFDIQCYAYGPPPSVSEGLAKNPRYRAHIHIIINENDWVPHLSYGAMLDFKAMVFAAAEIVNENRGSFLSFERLASTFQSSEAAAETREAQFKALNQARNHHKEVQHLNPKLYLPGKVHHMLCSTSLPEPFSYSKTANTVYKNLEMPHNETSQDSQIKSDSQSPTLLEAQISSPLTQEFLRPPYYYMATVDAEEFIEVRVHGSMLMDHLPTSYDKSFQSCLDLINRLQKDTFEAIVN